MEQATAPKAKPGPLLLIVSIMLFAFGAILYHAVAMRKGGNPFYAYGYSAARAVIAPMIIAGFFCIPKEGRNLRRFTLGFAIASGVLLLLAVGQFSQTAH